MVGVVVQTEYACYEIPSPAAGQGQVQVRRCVSGDLSWRPHNAQSSLSDGCEIADGSLLQWRMAPLCRCEVDTRPGLPGG